MRLKSLQSAGFALVLCGALAAGCAPTVQVHGYVPSATDIARIRPGFDDTGSVEEILGRPSSNGVLRDSAWYYVSSVVENYTYHPPRVVDRTVLAVNFDQNGVVRDIQRYGLAGRQDRQPHHPHHRDRRPAARACWSSCSATC